MTTKKYLFFQFLSNFFFQKKLHFCNQHRKSQNPPDLINIESPLEDIAPKTGISCFKEVSILAISN